jgi:hypothetical protein
MKINRACARGQSASMLPLLAATVLGACDGESAGDGTAEAVTLGSNKPVTA